MLNVLTVSTAGQGAVTPQIIQISRHLKKKTSIISPHSIYCTGICFKN